MSFRTGLFATLMASMLLAATYVPAVNAANEIKRLVPFQGRLHGTDAKVVTDGHYDLTFYIYDTPTGGTALWTEAHPKVSVIHGYINVLLGATTAMDEASYAAGDPNYDSSKSLVDFTKQKFLGISINGGAEMFPRSQLVPSFHAYTANHAEHATEADHAKNSDNLGNIAAAAYVTEAELSGFSGGILHSSGSLGELADKAASRTNLDVYSKAEASAQMLDAASNLSDVTNSATARANLNVYSKSETDGVYLNAGSNLSDIGNADTARVNLDVHSKSSADVVYLNSTSNLSDLPNTEIARNVLNVHSKTQADAAYLDAGSNLEDLADPSVARDNLGLQQDIKDNIQNSYSRVDIGKLRIYFGNSYVSGDNYKTITAEPGKCFANEYAYSVVATLYTTDYTADMPVNTTRPSGCQWNIANSHPNTNWTQWIAIGMAAE